MKIGEIRDLIRLKPIERGAAARRLSACHDIDDLRRVARRVVPRPVFDYVDGGAVIKELFYPNPLIFIVENKNSWHSYSFYFYQKQNAKEGIP